MTIFKLQKKPIVIDGIQFDGTNEAEIASWSGNDFHTVDPAERGDDPDIIAEVYDKLHSTWVGVKEGQWVVRGVKGEYYPIDPDALAESYFPPEPL